MNALLSAGTGLSNFTCSAEDCLSWIIILLNILTVFYLVFCAWFKITKVIRVIGCIWAVLLTAGTVAVLIAHTCIFSILSAVFTVLVLMAVMFVVFSRNASKGKGKKQQRTESREEQNVENTTVRRRIPVSQSTYCITVSVWSDNNMQASPRAERTFYVASPSVTTSVKRRKPE